MNRFNRNKLQGSKWTAVSPVNREKHFLVVDVERDEEGFVTGCTIEAVHSRREEFLKPDALKDSSRWKQGWH